MMFRANPNVLLTELADATGVLLDLESKFYFALNSTGIFVWKLLAAAPQSPDSLAEALAHDFAVDRETASRDVGALLDELSVERLVTRQA